MALFQERKDGIKAEAYVISIDDKESKGIYWVSLFIETYDENGVETIENNNGIMNHNEKRIEEGYHSDHRKHKYKLVDEPKKQPNKMFIHKE